MSQPKGFQDKVSLIWSVADILRGDFKPHEYGQTILPFVVLRRLECALEKTKDKVIAKSKSLEGKINDLETILNKESGHNFYNTSPLSLTKILQDPDKVASNLNSYIRAFSPSASEVLDKYGFPDKIKKLEEQGLLYQIIGKFADLDLSEESVSNEAMGYVFEELLRKFSEMSNETAGEHYTPREVIRLMVSLLFVTDSKALAGQAPIRSIYDPACGTGGMLSVAEEYLKELNPKINLNVFGQELNAETWAIARSDLMIKGQDPTRIAYGNSLTSEDGHSGTKFDYIISNPPYGVDWKKYQNEIQDEFSNLGHKGRYGAGLPRVSDGSFLFIQHMLSKMKNKSDGNGSRMAVILSASPLTSGGADSSESNIRKWILENDYLEAVIAIPDQMFYNTKIFTYIWILTNRKLEIRKGKVVLVDARKAFSKMRKGLGEKQKYISDEDLESILLAYEDGISGNEKISVVTKDTLDFQYVEGCLEFPLKGLWVITEEDASKMLVEDQEKLRGIIGKTFTSEAKLTEKLKDLDLRQASIKLATKIAFKEMPDGEKVIDKNGLQKPNVKMRTSEYIQVENLDFSSMSDQKTKISKALDAYFEENIRKHQSESWFDIDRTKLGFQIPFSRIFYEHLPAKSKDLIIPRLEELMDKQIGWIRNGK